MKKVTIYYIKVGNLYYIGSTWDYAECVLYHKAYYKNEHIDSKLYDEIRNADFEWKDLEIKVLTKVFMKRHIEIERRKLQQIYINKYDSVNTGLNDRNAYVTPEERKKQLSINQKKYNIKNKDKITAYQKIYNNNNKPKIQANQKIYNERAKLKRDINNIFKIWTNYHDIFQK
jgi:hypothetical protein